MVKCNESLKLILLLLLELPLQLVYDLLFSFDFLLVVEDHQCFALLCIQYLHFFPLSDSVHLSVLVT